ncbi:DinB family protein [Ornithinibacillus sp. L9]|uniref:DinB family protein n=1 Tax=Ornithinibacillus caprae TaxID=2678566 RepID=A0A6N8FI70_9BACI|nr:DinB family protein [Ornithinibacillus caprae]MUK87954.1 DinB family protein [Ornithinibacillus caprae]
MNKTIRQFNQTMDDIVKVKDIQESHILEPIAEGKWSIREIIGHMYYWDKFNLENMVPQMSEGAKLPSYPDHDQFNAEAISALEGESVESIIDYFVATRKELIHELETINENIRFTIGKGKRQLSVESFTNIFLRHDQHHLDQIKMKLNY